MRFRLALLITLVPWAVAGQDMANPGDTLPPVATTKLAASLKEAAAHKKHVWRDTAPMNADGTVNGYVEIARGDRRKWELNMGTNARAIDRMMPADLGGYPINYGIVPQTVSYDGDPFDVLVLGPPIDGGTLVRGVIVGLMLMEDEKGLDSKVVLSRVDRNGKPTHSLTPDIQRTVGEYFNRYKLHEPNAFSTVPGWGSAAQALAWVKTTHAFFKNCRERAGAPCQVRQVAEEHMDIKRSGSQPSGKGPAEYFTGTVRIDPLFQAPDPGRAVGNSVTFEPGARTAWHTHPLGQTLIVTAGGGLAQREGGPVEHIRPGDVIWFAPGEKHWHGAGPTTAMTHIAIQERLDGKAVDWMEYVSDEQYQSRATITA